MCEFIESIEGIRNTLELNCEMLKNAEAELDYCDRKSQDILHEMELVEHSYHEIAKLGVELIEIRQRRRAAKDVIELLTPVVEWKNEQKVGLQRLNDVIGKMRKIKEKQTHRLYYYRADNIGEIIGEDVKK